MRSLAALLLIAVATAQSPCMDVIMVHDYSEQIRRADYVNYVIPFMAAVANYSFPDEAARNPRYAASGFGISTDPRADIYPRFATVNKITFSNYPQTRAQIPNYFTSSVLSETGGLPLVASGLGGSRFLFEGASNAYKSTLGTLAKQDFTQVQIVISSGPNQDGASIPASQVCCTGSQTYSGNQNRVCQANLTKHENATWLENEGVLTMVVGIGTLLLGQAPSATTSVVKDADLSCLASTTESLANKAISPSFVNNKLGMAGSTPMYFSRDYGDLVTLGRNIGEALRNVCDKKSTFPPTVAPTAFGDPHFVTSDGLAYTFNGIGDFRYLATDDFDLHVRTHIVSKTSAALSGLAFRYKDLHVLAMWNGASSEDVMLAVNNVGIGEKSPEYRNASQGFTATRRLTPVGEALELAIDVGFKVLLHYGGRSSFQLTVPDAWRGRTRGLAGNSNSDPKDDLMRPDGSYLPMTASAREIHYQFGETWAVDPSESLLRSVNALYQKQGEQYNREFTPVFEPRWSSNELRVKAEQLCRGSRQCLYDAAATGSLKYAEHTLKDQMFALHRMQSRVVSVGSV